MARGDVTQLLAAAESGDRSAFDALYRSVYDELRRMAQSNMRREGRGHTLQPTALVNEAYLRLGAAGSNWENRRHFFGAAAEAMRRILVENARRKGRLKRGGELQRCDLQITEPAAKEINADVLMVDEALTALAHEHPERAQLVKLRYFAGLTLADAAAALGISTATADRHWRYARAWLAERLREH